MFCAELGPRRGAVAKALIEDVLKRVLRPSNAALAMEAAAVLDMTEANTLHEESCMVDDNSQLVYENKTRGVAAEGTLDELH
jgi:hypothetical protein